MKHSLAQTQVAFRHNDPEALRDALAELVGAQPLIRQGQRCVLIAVEAVYSMDGDVCPLQEFVDVAREELPRGNFVLIVDEAHSTGVLGEDGRGLVCALGLDRRPDVAMVRLHTYGKGLAATGAAILCNETVRNALLNFARPLIYTTAPSFPMLASIRAGYKLLTTGKTREVS
jgi:8-amino-7-oxononanoate synthase